MNCLYPLAKRFIAGHDFDSAKPVISNLMQDGYKITIDYLGELSKTTEDCHKAQLQYHQILDYYSQIPGGRKIDISIKPTQLGLLLDKENCFNRLNKIVWSAYHYGMTVRLDMDDSNVTQDTIDLCVRVKKTYPNIGIALQSNLYRTTKDIDYLLNEKVSIRLVKGAYKEDITKAYQKQKLVYPVFLQQALKLISDRCRSYYYFRDDRVPRDQTAVPAIGTHDEDLILDIIDYLPTIKVDKSDLFFELLYGVRRDICFSLKNDGYCVRLYVPFGTEWLPYTMRRLREYKNLKFIIFNIIKELMSGKAGGY